jgi:hypothetical protein
VLAIAGCSSPLTPSQYITDEENATCARDVKCGVYPSTAVCLSAFQPKSISIATVEADIADKKIAFSSAAASGCIDYIESLSCDNASVFDQSSNTDCSNVTTGTVGSGDTCFVSAECVPSFQCQYTSTTCDATTTCCAGTCVAMLATVAIGDSCASGAPCVIGAYCSDESETCKAIATSVGDVCEALDGCASPLLCFVDENNGPTGTCMTPIAHGATCDATLAVTCAEFTDFCDPSTKVCTSRASAGAACEVAPDDARCVGYDVCSNGQCVAAALVGSACTVDTMTGLSNCISGVSCSTNGICEVPPAGSACM